MKKTFAILILLLLLPFSIHAFSINGERKVQSLRCFKGKIIKPHLSKAEVLEACGKPTTVVDLGTHEYESQVRVPHEEYDGVKVWKAIKNEVKMERWIYRRSGRFPIIITFRNGYVQSLAYGDK